MSIFSRLTDIVNSNINALVASAEDPAKLIRLIIQEMEDTLVEVRSQAVRTIAERKELERRIATLRREEDEWTRKAELALTRDREDLARGALQAANHRERARVELESQLAVIADGLAQQGEDIAKLQAKLADAKARERSLASRRDTAVARIKLREKIHDEKLGDAFFRFEQAERALDRMEGRVESYDLGRPPSLEEEIAKLEDPSVEDALARMKARLGNKPAIGETKSDETGRD